MFFVFFKGGAAPFGTPEEKLFFDKAVAGVL